MIVGLLMIVVIILLMYHLVLLKEVSKKLDEPESIIEVQHLEESHAELHKLGVGENEEDEDELPEEIRVKMNNSRGIWEEDALDPEEIERL